MSDLIGCTLGGRYEILELIGAGGTATIYKARHVQLDRLVAVKVLHHFLVNDAQFSARFEREAHLIAQLHHPNIIQVYDFEFVPGECLYYMVVELISGASLDQYLARLEKCGGSLSLAEALRIGREVANALSYAHEHGMIHRDIKPANVLLEQGQRVVLTDFGIARLMAHSSDLTVLTGSNALLGTPAYMAPEQCLEEPSDARTDIYALGVMLYEMVTGQLPFSATTVVGMILNHIHTVPLPAHLIKPDVPLGVSQIINRCLEKQPDQRFQSACELLDELHRLSETSAINGISAGPLIEVGGEADMFTYSALMPMSIDLSDSNATPDMLAAPEIAFSQPHQRIIAWRSLLAMLTLLLVVGGALWGVRTVMGTRDADSALPGVAASPTQSPTATATSTDTPTSTSTATATMTLIASPSAEAWTNTGVSPVWIESPTPTVAINPTGINPTLAPTYPAPSVVPTSLKPTHVSPTRQVTKQPTKQPTKQAKKTLKASVTGRVSG